MASTTISSPDGTTCLPGGPAHALLPPGTQVTEHTSGLVRLIYPMPGWLPATVTLVPTRGAGPALVHLHCDRNLIGPELDGLRQLLAAAERWRDAQPAPEGPAGQQLLDT